MSAPEELKIIFTGPMGAGKTTAIIAASDAPPVSTEASNNDQASFAKESTTVALDFGQLALQDGTTVRLYGTPGQERFSFMWEILGRGAMGVILLIDGSSPAAVADLELYATEFRRISPDQPLVVGVGRTDPDSEYALSPFVAKLSAFGLIAPVFSVDVRKPEDSHLLIQTVLALLESRTPEAAYGSA